MHMLDLESETLSPETSASRSAEQRAVVPDLLLIERARTRDARAWEAIMQRYNQRLFRIARSILLSPQACMDLVTESYLLAFADIEHCEPEGKLGAWLGRITFTQAMSCRGLTAPPAAHVPGACAPDSAGEGEAGATRLEEAIDALPQVFRTVFVLRVLEGVTGTETAACLGVKETTVRTRLYRAHRRLPAGAPERATAQRGTLFGLSGAQSSEIINRVFARLER